MKPVIPPGFEPCFSDDPNRHWIYNPGKPNHINVRPKTESSIMSNTIEVKPKFIVGMLVQKIKGSQWRGRIVGTYSTSLTPEGYCVESVFESGSVQIYPASALEIWEGIRL